MYYKRFMAISFAVMMLSVGTAHAAHIPSSSNPSVNGAVGHGSGNSGHHEGNKPNGNHANNPNNSRGNSQDNQHCGHFPGSTHNNRPGGDRDESRDHCDKHHEHGDKHHEHPHCPTPIIPITPMMPIINSSNTHYPDVKPTIDPPVIVLKPFTPTEETPIVQVEQPPERVIIEGVHFDFDKDTLQQSAYPILSQVVDIANKNPQWNFILTGHTDSIGTDDYNMDLSLRRVQTVQHYLISQGIADSRLINNWKGEQEPIATNDTNEGRAQNRRVEIVIQ